MAKTTKKSKGDSQPGLTELVLHAGILERITDAFIALDKNDCFTYVNRKAGEIFQRKPEALTGRHIWTEFADSIGQPFQLAYEKARKNQEYVYLEEYYAPRDRWFENHIYPSPEGITVFFRDITDRRKTEEKLNKSNRLYNFISQVNQLIVRTKVEETLFSDVCGIAIHNGKFRLAWIGLLNKESGIVEPVVFDGLEQGYLKEIRKINIGLSKSGKGPTGTAIRRGETVVCNDMATDPRMEPWRKEALARGFRSSIAVPIRRSGEVIGAFSLYAEETGFFDAAEIALLEEATGDISFALDNFDREKRNQEAERTVRTSEEKLRRIFDATNDVLFMLESDGQDDFRFISVNRRFTEVTGLPESSIVGNSASAIIPPASWTVVKEKYRQAIRENKTLQWEETSVYPNGTRTGIVTVTPVRHEKEGLYYLIGSVQDITEIRQYTQMLDKANERFNLIARATHDALWEMNLETGYLWGNAAHQALYGRTMEDPVPQPKEWLSRIHPADRESVQRQQEVNLRSAANTFITEYRFRNGQEEYRHIYDRCYIIRNAEGKPVRMLGSMMDVTTLKQTEVALRRKGEQLQTLGDNLPGTMIYQRVREMDGRVHFSYLSREVESLTGKKAAEVVEHPEIIYALILEEDKEEFVLRENESFEKMSVFNREVRVRDYRGNIRWLNVRSIPRKEPDGRIIWDGVLVDITEQKTAAEKISKERNLSDSLIDSLPGIFYLYAKDGTFLRWNTNFETVSGYTAAEIAAIHPLDFYQGDEKELLRRKIENVFLTGEDTVEAGFLQKSGNRVPYFFTGRRIFYNEQECLMGVGIDVTERVKAQQEIREANKRLRQLTTHLQTIREEERKRIGREIHDELGQQLTAIKMDVAWLDRRIPDSETAYKEKLKSMISLLDSSHLSVRKILNELRMGILEHQQLDEALKWYAGQFTENSGIPLQFECPAPVHVTDEAVASCLYRAMQEALTNIIRYARASEVRVNLWKEENRVYLRIADNGTGFDKEAIDNHSSFGILGMNERVYSLGGKLQLDTAPGNGTRILIELPVEHN